jgi:hypothetical protein
LGERRDQLLEDFERLGGRVCQPVLELVPQYQAADRRSSLPRPAELGGDRVPGYVRRLADPAIGSCA